jgi:hypothetical protein
MEAITIMNVDDAEKEEITGDMLEMIFERQKELMDKYHPIEEKAGIGYGILLKDDVRDLNNPRFQYLLKDFAWRITEEIGEAMSCLKQKPWKQTHMMTDETHFKEEIVDAFHFFIEMCILIGFDPVTLTEMYLKKSLVNKFRQKSMY